MEFSIEELGKFSKSTEVFLAILSPDGTFKKANQNWKDRFFTGDEELAEVNLAAFIVDSDRALFRTLLSKTRKSKSVLQAVLLLVDGHKKIYSFRFDFSYIASEIFLVGFDITASEEQTDAFREMSKVTKTGVWSYDPIRDDSFWSREVFEIYGLPYQKQIEASDLSIFFPPPYKEQFEAHVDHLYANLEPYDFIGQIQTRAGAKKWVRTIAWPIVQDRTIIKVYGVTSDRTEVQESIQKLEREAETRLLALKGIKSGLFDHDLKNDTVSYSPDLKDLVGMPTDKNLPEPEFRKLIHPEDREIAYTRHLNQLQGTSNQYFNFYRLNHLQEGYQHYEVYGWIKRNDQHAAVRMVGNLINVHEKVLAKEEKEKVTQSLRAMVDNGYIYSILMDTEGYVLMADQRADRIIKDEFGVDVQEKPVKYVQLMPEVFQETFLKEFAKVLKGQEVRKEVERPLWEGTMEWIDVRYHPVKDSNGEVIQVLLNMSSITERKKAEIAIVESESRAQALGKLKSDLLSNISHELKTPLAGIVGVSDLLLQKDISEEAKQLVVLQKESEKRLLALIDTLMSLGDLDALRASMVIESKNFNDLVSRSYKTYSYMARAKKLDFSVVLLAQDEIVAVDENMFIAAISSIIHNALKFTTRGEVAVRCELTDNDQVQVKVIDTGIGISEQHLPKIFENFESINFGMSSKYEGSGLGLSQADQFIRLMHGKIEAESNLGKGSTFKVTLPIAKAVTAASKLKEHENTDR